MSNAAPLLAVPAQTQDAFLHYGAPGVLGPLVIAVPHAGRSYAPALLARARVPEAVLARLEDRLVDHLVHPLANQGHCVLVARQPRALIDLNRDEREIDPASISDAPWRFRGQTSAKLRGGLGLIPERLAQVGPLWNRPLPYAQLCACVEGIHRPYHAMLAALLDATRRQHGIALLLDVHSMPPLRQAPGGAPPPQIVIGDRFGRSAADRLTDLCADFIRRRQLTVAMNSPYPGNHILDRHGRPERGVHAIQIEIDRTLYLDSTLMEPGEGLPAMQALLADLAGALTQELGERGLALAAE
ncbi:MAG TPA: N-formylglutamate amidohydrolase [Sphingobium sp.]|nr:N-formylglutamate amidohydrolase [Sphingobium sp.]